MKPIHVAIFAVLFIVLGVLTSFWLREETDMQPLAPKEPERVQKVDTYSKIPKLVVMNPRIEPGEGNDHRITYTLANASQAPLEEFTRVVIFPYRFATPHYLGTEEPVEEGQQGWNDFITDVVQPLEAGGQLQRTVELPNNPNFEPSSNLIPRVHFAIEGHPQSKR